MTPAAQATVSSPTPVMKRSCQVLAASLGLLSIPIGTPLLIGRHARQQLEQEAAQYARLTFYGKMVYDTVDKGNRAVFATIPYYKQSEFLFGRQYTLCLQALADESGGENTREGKYEAAKLLFGYHDQATGNLAFKMLMRHTCLFQSLRPPLEQLESMPEYLSATPQVQADYRLDRLAITDLTADTRLLLKGITSVVYSNPKQLPDIFARRIELALQQELDPSANGLLIVKNFFVGMDLTNIPPSEFRDFLLRHKLDQSKLVRQLFCEAAQHSNYYSELIASLPPITCPIVPLPFEELVTAEPIKMGIEAKFALLHTYVDSIGKRLDEIEEEENKPEVPRFSEKGTWQELTVPFDSLLFQQQDFFNPFLELNLPPLKPENLDTDSTEPKGDISEPDIDE